MNGLRVLAQSRWRVATLCRCASKDAKTSVAVVFTMQNSPSPVPLFSAVLSPSLPRCSSVPMRRPCCPDCKSSGNDDELKWTEKSRKRGRIRHAPRAATESADWLNVVVNHVGLEEQPIRERETIDEFLRLHNRLYM